jgi:Tol biopolymer transport system component
MKKLRHSRMRLMLAAIAVSVLIGGGIAQADFTFGERVNLGPNVNSSAGEEDPEISVDGLKLYFNSNRAGGYGSGDIWVTSRVTIEDDWSAPENLGLIVNSSSDDFAPDVSPDGLILHFASDRPGGYGSYDIWVTSRVTPEDDWGTPVNLGPAINTSGMDGCPAVLDDGLELYFWSNRPGSSGMTDLWVAKRATLEDDWGTPVNLGLPVNSTALDFCPHISSDDLALFFASGRAGGYGGFYGDIWISTRTSISDTWGTPVNLGLVVNSFESEAGPAVSNDGLTFYFSSERSGGFGSFDIYQAPIIPIVDFNDDGNIDTDDLVIMIENWNTNESLYDIGPMPWGDGVVDMKDLEVFMSCWEAENMSQGME